MAGVADPDPDDGPAVLRVDLLDEPEGPVIRLRGELDISSADALRSQIEDLRELNPERLVFDLGGLDFIDTSGIALLLELAATGQTVVLREPSDGIRRVLEATGVSQVLRLEP
jgi:anti-sigma B factor antagonist